MHLSRSSLRLGSSMTERPDVFRQKSHQRASSRNLTRSCRLAENECRRSSFNSPITDRLGHTRRRRESARATVLHGRGNIEDSMRSADGRVRGFDRAGPNPRADQRHPTYRAPRLRPEGEGQAREHFREQLNAKCQRERRSSRRVRRLVCEHDNKSREDRHDPNRRHRLHQDRYVLSGCRDCLAHRRTSRRVRGSRGSL